MNSKFGVRFAAGLIVAICLMVTGCAQGSGGDAVDFSAQLNGVDIAETGPRDPIALTNDETAQLELSVRSTSDQPVTVGFVRFEGQVLDMIFLTYDTAIRVDLEPGETQALPPILLDFFDLDGQANGYLRGHVQLYDDDRELLGAQPVFLDAQGSGLSTLTLFNLLLLAATVAGAAWNLMRLAQRKLPMNRMVRAMRFLAIGAAAAMTLAVAFSTLRIWPLTTFLWIVFVVVGAIVGYAIGFVLPGSDDAVIDLLDEQDVIDAVLDEQARLVEG